MKKVGKTTTPFRYDLNQISGSDSKASVCNTGDPGLIPGLERSPGERNGFPFQYSCLGDPVDRGAMVIVHGVTKRVRLDLATK